VSLFPHAETDLVLSEWPTELSEIYKFLWLSHCRDSEYPVQFWGPLCLHPNLGTLIPNTILFETSVPFYHVLMTYDGFLTQ
jgi:hypothetical protein